jgi:cyclopropane fatty-acyl-phospholipid synthase-like methyltransferase
MTRSQRLNKKNKGWVVKNDRPEEYLQDAFSYYTDEEVEKYAKSGGMRRAQEKIAYRVIELLEIKEGKILDLGCGVGYTAKIYKEEGFDVKCIDLIPKMVDKAKEKGFDVDVCDMRNIKNFFNQKFDAVVSVSAFQWIKNKEEIKRVAEGIHYVLKKEGISILQFYPKSEKELNETAKIFANNGFLVEIITDWPNVPKNRTIYLKIIKTPIQSHNNL